MNKHIRAWWESLAAGLLWILVALHWRPLIYNFDGYMYPLEGKDPLDTMNAHHLFWIPAQALFNAMALKFGLAPRWFCQTVGILLSGLFIALFYRFLVRLSRHQGWSIVAILFVALSPQYWFLTMQNLPYIPFFIFSLLAVWACAWYLKTHSPWSMVAAVAALAMGVQFHQASVLLFFPLAFFFIWTESQALQPKWATLALCFLLSVLLVCGPYLVIAHLMNIDSVSEFRSWVTDYLDSQHSLQFRAIGLVQMVIGITRCAVQSDVAEFYFKQHLRQSMIILIYSGIGCLLLLTFFFNRRRLRPAPQHRRLAHLCVGLMAIWSVFLFSWEPLMAHFWCINLILAVLYVTTAFPQWTPVVRGTVISLMLIISAWNGYANYWQDQREETRNPDAWLAEIHQQVGPQDLLLFFARDRIDHVDYDLLAQVLARERPDALRILLPDDQSATDLHNDLEAVRARGGKIWVSSWILDPKQYQDIAGEHNIFSPYPMKNLHGLNGPALFQMAARTLAPYHPTPSTMVMNHDHFLKID